MSTYDSQQGSGAVSASTMTDEQRWGEPISDERRNELENYLQAWAAEGETHMRQSPFAPSTEDTISITLTGADIFHIAARTIAGPNASQAEVEAAIARLSLARDNLRAQLTLDLSGLHLESVHLEGAHLEGACLRGVHLERANLRGVHLEHAALPQAHLQGAILDEAHLEHANLREAHLEEAHLGLARLEHASLHRTYLERASFYQAQLSSAFLEHADLRQAILIGARLDGARLSHCDLERADLRDAHVEYATLTQARLEYAALGGAHLEHANFDRANLQHASLYQAHLEGASFQMAHLEHTFLDEAHLEHANLAQAHLEGARLGRTHLGHAILTAAHMKGASLDGAHLEHANLALAHLESASLYQAHLEGANLTQALLNNARLIAAFFDNAVQLNDTILTDASLDQASFNSANLAVVDWSKVPILGDERTARTRRYDDNSPKKSSIRLREFKSAVQANRLLAVALEEQGLNEEAARFAYRAQLLQQQVLWRQKKIPAYVFSRFLDSLAGYGYRPGRGVLAYLLVVVAFAAAYWLTGPSSGHRFAFDGALVFSVTSFHGRGFFPGGLDLENWITRLAAFEAVIGLLIEISFIATFTQRFFGAK